ncbi:FHA domain-containing protein [Bacillus sp. FJAT-29953]|nr:FHA domain-containing protein [Bacillus sp. FJAT-29953]
MGKTTVEQQANKYLVVNKLIDPEAINERELKGVAAGLFGSLLPVAAEKTKKGLILRCHVEGMMTLQSYFSGIVSKKMFLGTMARIAAVAKECEKNLLNVSNLMLNWETIFLDPRTKEVKCIYWPIVNNQNASVVPDFFNDITFRAVFNKHEDNGYVTSYLQYFRSHSPFSINGFEKLLFELLGKTVDNKGYLPSGSTGSVGDGPRESGRIGYVAGAGKTGNASSEKGRPSSIAYNPFSNQYDFSKKLKACPSCGAGSMEDAKFCSACGTALEGQAGRLEAAAETKEPFAAGPSETEHFSGTTVLGVEDVGGTTVLEADVYEEPRFPYLVREKTQEEISVDKPAFRIGKERSYCDYFVSNNNAISRSHADIITRGGRYYIIDNNSTNKTYVDGRVIPVMKEIEIFSGTKLRLANEDFTFYI